MGASCKKSLYDFLRRHYPHQVKGSKFDYFLSACLQAPLFLFVGVIIHLFRKKCKGFPIFPE